MSSSPLLRLPGELRDMIYSFAFGREERLVYLGQDLKFHQHQRLCEHSPPDPWPLHNQILQVNKQIRAEAGRWFWDRLTLTVLHRKTESCKLSIVERIQRSKPKEHRGSIDLSVFRSVRVRIPWYFERTLQMMGPNSFESEISQDLEVAGLTNIRSLQLAFVIPAIYKVPSDDSHPQSYGLKGCRDGQINVDFGRRPIPGRLGDPRLQRILNIVENILFGRVITERDYAIQQWLKETSMREGSRSYYVDD